MSDKPKTLLHKGLLLGRGVLVFVVLLAVLLGTTWLCYHRYPDVARWEGTQEDPMKMIRLSETDMLYIRVGDPSDAGENEVGPSYPSDRRLGEVKPTSLRQWNTAYIVEHIKDREDLLYVIIDGQKMLYELHPSPSEEIHE